MFRIRYGVQDEYYASEYAEYYGPEDFYDPSSTSSSDPNILVENLFTATPIFSAITRLQIDNETENSMRMESFVMEGMQGQDYLQTQYKNLQSRSLMALALAEQPQPTRGASLHEQVWTLALIHCHNLWG